jgi:cytochrome c-type biogenesis protein CcmH
MKRAIPFPSPLRLILALCLAIGLLVSLMNVAVAQSVPPVTDDQVNAIAKELYCPVCENIPLDVCPTQACMQWRELIRQKIAEGLSEAEIKEYFATQYGDRVLAEPPLRGLNWALYILLPVAFVAGIFLVVRVMRSTRKPVAATPPQPPATSAHDDPYLRQVEEELRKRGSA